MLINLDFCSLELFNNYVICIVNEGVTICKKNSDKQTEFILNHFQNKPFVYITNRINSYSVNPLIYKNISKIKNLLGFAVVSQNETTLNNVEIEKLFFNGKPFKPFTDLEQAINWANCLTL
ncbi:hypothetical protein [Lacinutrix mariniflava]|uniref:hypothetical protein n=1 Tax=Lacinutrix mariniflava TaxID=342955 RepID=UPI0006E25C79|nr:hypothetical protein [Lacinutrix mariniflava]